MTILLLGTADSGKSTVVKQMKVSLIDILKKLLSHFSSLLSASFYLNSAEEKHLFMFLPVKSISKFAMVKKGTFGPRKESFEENGGIPLHFALVLTS